MDMKRLPYICYCIRPVEKTGKKVNILSANTKSVKGIGYGQMVLELPADKNDQEIIINFFKDSGLSVQEVNRA